MSSGSAGGSNASWLSLLEEKKQKIAEEFGRGYERSGAISNGRLFRTALENFGKKRGEQRVSRLCAQLLPSYKPITELAKAVGDSAADLSGLAPNHSLEGLIWWTSFALIDHGWKAGAQLHSLIDLVAELNNRVPSFSTNVGPFCLRYPNEKEVQKPLQEVYGRFIDSHLFLASYLKQNPEVDVRPSNNKNLEGYITETGTKFEEARGIHYLMVSQVAEDEERQKTILEQPSLQVHRGTSTAEVGVRFLSMKTLGRGSYGTVDEVRETSTGASYARKHIPLDDDRSVESIADEVKNEVAVMQKLRHLHIASVLFYLKEEDAYSIFMLPVADYDLRRFLSNCTTQGYPIALTKQILPWFGCLLDALAYAHKLKIKHRDIKPSNILIKNNQPYLCDFGLAKDFAESDASSSHGDKVQGTVVYRAPEVQPNKVRGSKADVFALGCVYSEMLTVNQDLSLEEYRTARQESGSTAFRDCLPKVERWLRRFEGRKHINLLVDQILSMVHEDLEERHTAEKALNFLKPERSLFCIE